MQDLVSADTALCPRGHVLSRIDAARSGRSGRQPGVRSNPYRQSARGVSIPVLFMQVQNGQLLTIRKEKVQTAVPDLAPAPGESPYKGLQYFDVADVDCFFGRETLTAELVGLLRVQRLLVVVGDSGNRQVVCSARRSDPRVVAPARSVGGRGPTARGQCPVACAYYYANQPSPGEFGCQLDALH